MGEGGGGGGAAPQAPPLDLFFSSTLPPSPEDQPWQLLGWAPKVMAWAQGGTRSIHDGGVRRIFLG